MQDDTEGGGQAQFRWADLGPFGIVPEWVIEADVSDRAVRLYALVARLAMSPEARIVRGHAELERRLRCGRTALKTAIRELAAIGALDVQAEPTSTGAKGFNSYSLRAVRPAADAPQPSRGRDGAPGAGAPVQRAPARGGEKDPKKTPVPNGTVATDGSQALVGFYVDEARRRGSDPPRRTVGQVARYVGELLGEGVEPDRVRNGILRLLDRRLNPNLLANCVVEAELAERPRHGGMTPEEIRARGAQVAAERDAIEGDAVEVES